jgi:hypothetical protein
MWLASDRRIIQCVAIPALMAPENAEHPPSPETKEKKSRKGIAIDPGPPS